MSIIQRFFTLPPYIIRKIVKPENVINEVAPNLYQNFRDSSKQFIKAVINKDGDFIRQITARSLSDLICEDLQQYKNSDFIQNFNLKKYHFDSAEGFEISPYVIFGEDLKERIQRPFLWENIRPISSNRFIKMDPKLSMIDRFRSYGKKQIFGFNCFYTPLLVDVKDSERANYLKPFMISFQTDNHNIDPFIVDCQGAMFEKWRATGSI